MFVLTRYLSGIAVLAAWFLVFSARAQALTPACPTKLDVLPLSMVAATAKVAADRRSADINYTINYPGETYAQVDFSPLTPREGSGVDRLLYTLGAVGCRFPAGQSRPTVVKTKSGWIHVLPTTMVHPIPNGQESYCHGAAGLAILDNTSMRRLPNTQLRCGTGQPPPNPEGRVVNGEYLDQCKLNPVWKSWTCRHRGVYLHAGGKSECDRWLGTEDKHEFQTYATIGPNGDRVALDALVLNFQVGDDKGSDVCKKTSWCARTITKWKINQSCQKRRCVSGQAFHGLSRWKTQAVCW